MSGVISAVIAVVAVASAASSVTAAVAAGAVTLSAVFTVTAAIGAVVSTIGALTGDRTLQTVGMVVGAIGGVGAIANSAGMFGAGATVEGLFGAGGDVARSGADEAGFAMTDWASEAAKIPAASATTSAEVAASAGGEALSSAVQPVTVNGIAEAGGFVSDAQKANLVAGGLGQGDAPTGAALDQVTGVTHPTPVDSSVVSGTPSTVPGAPTAPTAAPVAAPTTPTAPTTPAATPGAVSGTVQTSTSGASSLGGQLAANVGTATDSGGGAFSGIFDFMNRNSAMTMGTFQAASSFIAGAFGGNKEPAQEQLNYWQAQADANVAAANLQKQRLANMQTGVPTASGGGQITVTPPRGLINNHPTVTGVPA
ncbi:hypothetical protein [Reyranella sp.]|uniref:hypothetical protein n=1 Tax=Reyranella sp. TaxID=1929291 RepID=UPI0040374740